MKLKNLQLIYVCICISIIILIQYFLKIYDVNFYFNLVCFFLLVYFYCLFVYPNWDKFGYWDIRLQIASISFLIIVLVVSANRLEITYIGFLISVYISKMIFDDIVYTNFGKKIKSLPTYFSLILLVVGICFGNVVSSIFLFIEIIFLIYVYDKRKKLYESLKSD